jgi:hypothetical protein
VIRADVEVLDLDPRQWAALHELVLESRRLRHWGYVLHSEGRVLTRHPADVGVAPGDVVHDPQKTADLLYGAGGYDRVLVIDRDRLSELACQAAPLAEPDGDLTTYRERVDALYWASPAVVTAPAAPANPWRDMRMLAEALGSGLVHVLVHDESADRVVAAVALQVARGSVTRISSPTVDEQPEIVLAVTAGALVRALRSDSLVAHLLDGARRDARSRGLDRLGHDSPAAAPSTTLEEGITSRVS